MTPNTLRTAFNRKAAEIYNFQQREYALVNHLDHYLHSQKWDVESRSKIIDELVSYVNDTSKYYDEISRLISLILTNPWVSTDCIWFSTVNIIYDQVTSCRMRDAEMRKHIVSLAGLNMIMEQKGI